MIVNIEKRYAYAIIGLLVLATVVFVVHALTPGETPDPGHNIQSVGPPADCADGEVLRFIDSSSGWGCVPLPSLEETDPTVLASVKDGIAWDEISNRPAGLDDGDDNTWRPATSLSCTTAGPKTYSCPACPSGYSQTGCRYIFGGEATDTYVSYCCKVV